MASKKANSKSMKDQERQVKRAGGKLKESRKSRQATLAGMEDANVHESEKVKVKLHKDTEESEAASF